jgi:hypothetical protein
VSLRRFANDRQTHTRTALRLDVRLRRAVKSRKDMTLLGGRNAEAEITHLDNDIGSGSFYGDFDMLVAAAVTLASVA